VKKKFRISTLSGNLNPKAKMAASTFPLPVFVTWSVWCMVLHATDPAASSVSSVHPSCTAIFHQVWCAGAGLQQVPAIEIHPDNTTRYLDLSRNRIESLSWELEMYPFLEYLNLANNSINILSNAAFNDTRLLEELNLSANKLTSYILSDELFKPLSNLKVLALSYNFIGPRLNASVFRHLQKLTLLDLDYNNIMFLSGPGMGKDLASLSELRLRGNFLLDIPQAMWRFVTNLIQLDLSENAISVIEGGAFEALKSLKSLILSNNQYLREIKAFAFVSVNHLEYADISRCPKLREMSPMSFGSNATLKTLRLEHNNLSALATDMLHWRSSSHVYLAGNRWHCDCNLAWVRDLCGTGRVEDRSSVTCASPAHLNGRVVTSLTERDFHCAPEADDTSAAVMMELWEVAIVILSSIIASSCTVFFGMKLFNAFSRDHPEMFGGTQTTYGSLYESHDV
jgi:Leucine-rich repeat (LRR) protein